MMRMKSPVPYAHPWKSKPLRNGAPVMFGPEVVERDYRFVAALEQLAEV